MKALKIAGALGGAALLSVLVFGGLRATAQTGPIVADVEATVSSTNVVTITWTTDVTATSVLEYGTESGVYTGQRTTSSGTDHKVTFSDLAQNTAYYFRITAKDADGDTTQSGEQSFKTKSSSLIFTDLHVTALGANTMVVEARTNKDAYATLWYGTSATSLTTSVGDAIQMSPAGNTLFQFVVRNLTANTTYFFKATAAQNTTFYETPETAESVVESVTMRKQTKITSISPVRGSNGSKLTIWGQGFGGGHGTLNPELKTVVGLGCSISKWPKKAPTCLAQVLSWTDSKIVVRVGKNAKTGSIYIGKAFALEFPFDPVNIYTVRGPKFTKK